MNSTQHMRQLQWLIADMYKDHRLLAESYWDGGRGARWLIGQPGTNVMLTEVIAGVCGSLVVHGDCDTARFAHYSDYPDAWSRLRWMGFCRDVGYYVAQKASIGMGRSADYRHAYDQDVARHDLARFLLDVRRHGYEPETLKEIAALVREAYDYYTDSERELRDFLGHNDKGWDLWEYTFGEVVATPVITGHLALQRCAYLLLDKYGIEGPPECQRKERESRCEHH